MTDTRRDAAERKAFYRRMLRIAAPIALQSLMLALVAACDALMLGRVAQAQMTAVSLATQIQFVQNMILAAITGAGAILGAQYWGKGDRETVRRLFHLMLRFAGLVSLLFCGLCELVPDLLMRLFADDAALIAIGSDYLRIAGWSYLLTGVSQCYLATMKVTNHVGPSAWISSCAVGMNVALNAVFIFGLLGVRPMQARGAALATTISRGMELAICLAVSSREGYVRMELGRLFSGSGRLARDFARQCLPLLGGSLFWGVGFTSYTAIMGHMGVDAAAANSVAAVVRDLICCACNGIASAAGIMVGNALGAGDLEKGKVYGIRLMKLSYVIGFESAALVLAVTPLVVRAVILTDAARSYLRGMMVIMAVYMIGRCVSTVTITGVLDGGGDTVFDMYSLAVCMWGIAIPLALLGAFVFHWPVLLVYACTCLDEVGKIPWIMVRFHKYKWVRNLTNGQMMNMEGPYMDYNLLCAQLQGFAEADGWYVPLMANAAALLYDSMADLNWAGFYLMRGGKLVLGPFQGKVACIHIPVGKGVCGTAVAEDRTQLVANVHDFPGHIACDSASNSEIVVPIHRDGKVIGVLDIDSPSLNRFTEDDRAGLEAFVRVLEETVCGDWEA